MLATTLFNAFQRHYLTGFFASLGRGKFQARKVDSKEDFRRSKYLSRAYRFFDEADCCAFPLTRIRRLGFVTIEIGDGERVAAEDWTLEHRSRARSWRETTPCCT